MDDIMWFDIIIYAVGAKCEHGIGYRKIIIKQLFSTIIRIPFSKKR